MNKNIMIQNRVDLEEAELVAEFKRPGRRLAIAVIALAFWGTFIVDMLCDKPFTFSYARAIMALLPTLITIFWEKFTNFEIWFYSWMDR